MQRNNRHIVIGSISQAGAPRGSNRVGNLIVNQVGEAKPENWFNTIEFRNACLGKRLHPRLPLDWFKGAIINYEQIIIEPADVEGGKMLEIVLPGKDNMGNPRKVSFKKPGIANVNLSLNLDSLPMEKYMAMCELSMKFEQRTTSLGAGQTMAPPKDETLKDEDPKDPNAGNGEHIITEIPADKTLETADAGHDDLAKS